MILDDYTRTWQAPTLARAFVECFSELGFSVSFGNTSEGADPKGILFVLSARSFSGAVVPWEGPIILYNVAEAYLFAKRWWRNLVRYSAMRPVPRVDWVFDYSPFNNKQIAAWGWRYLWVPLGYHPCFEQRRQWPVFDLAFLGNAQERGRRWKLFIQHLREEEEFSVFAPGFGGAYRLNQYRGVWNGDAMRTRIFLHLNRMGRGVANFAPLRIIMLGLSNRLCVLAEEMGWMPDCLIPGKHLEVFGLGDYDDLVRRARRLLRSEAWRDLGRRGYKAIKRYKLVDHLRQGLKEASLL